MSDLNNNNRELGLIDIIETFGQWIVNGFKRIISFFLYTLFFAIKKWIPISVVLVIVAIATFINFKAQKSQYEAKMLIRSNSMPTAQMKPLLDNYSNLLNNNILTNEEIISKTNLNKEIRNNIISVKTFYCIDDNRDGIMDRVDNGRIKKSDKNLDSLNLCVKVIFNDTKMLKEVKHSINYYLNNIDFVKKSNEARLDQQARRKDFILKEIKLLDTVQLNSYGAADAASSASRQGGVLVDNRDVLEIYTDKVKLLKIHEDLEKEITIFKEPITLIEDFVITKSAINTLGSMMIKNLIYAFLSVLIALLLFVSIRKQKDKYMTKL